MTGPTEEERRTQAQYCLLEALQASEAHFRASIEQAPFGIMLFNVEGRCEMVNPAWERLWGISLSQLGDYNIFEDPLLGRLGLSGKIRSAFAGHVEVIEAHEYNPAEAGLRDAPERRLWLRSHLYPLRNPEGEVSHVVVVMEDITDRVHMERALKRSEQRYFRLAELIPDAIVIHVAGRWRYANPAALRIFGAESVTQLLDTPVIERVHPADRERVRARIRAVQEEQRPTPLIEERLLRLDGSPLWAEVQACPIELDEGTGVLAVVRDITEHKQHEWVRDTLLRMRTACQQEWRLADRLQHILDSMFDNPWDVLAGQGAIFASGRQTLRLAASRNWQMPSHFDGEPALSKCLCGQPMQSESSVFCPALAEAGDDGKRWLCLPLMHEGERLGLLVFSVRIAAGVPPPFEEFCSRVQELLVAMLHRERVQRELAANEHKYRILVESANVVPWQMSVCSREFLYIGEQIGALTGFAAETWRNAEVWLQRMHPEDRCQAEAALQRATSGEAFAFEYRVVTANGETVWIRNSISLIDDVSSQPCWIGYMFDISEHKAAESKLEWLSYYDELTGLPNRRLFGDRAEQAIAMAHRAGKPIAMLYIDLDRFKYINDSLGHHCGDDVLVEVASRLRSGLRTADTVACMGGDEFAVLLPGAQTGDAIRVARKLRELLQRSHRIHDQDLVLDASIGISVYPEDGESLELMLKHADIAMYHAKGDRTHIHCFSRSMEEQAVHRLQLEQELAHAAAHGQLQLYYQAQHLTDTHERKVPFPLHYQGRHRMDEASLLIGMEALVRWRHPQFGMVSPAEFIPLAEETGLIWPITQWVFAEAGRQARVWDAEGIRPERVGVNLSAVQLMQKGIAGEIIELVHGVGAEPQWLEIEITETAAMREPESGILIMRELVEAGFSVAIDDFGTGYSSLAYLKRFPAQWLKIDITFIRGLPEDQENAAIVRSIIAMAHSLGIQTVAEGVENRRQMEFLRMEGCDAVQGFLLGRPLPSKKATSYLRRAVQKRAAGGH